MPLINEIFSAAVQLLLFSLIPFLYYIIKFKKFRGFLRWIGLFIYRPIPIKSILLIFIGFAIISFLPLYWLYSIDSLSFEGFIFDSYAISGWSISTILIILIYSIFQTSLSEEIVFRGFIIRIFTNNFGANVGNIVQSVLFGLIHIFAVINSGIIPAILVFILTGGIGYALGWLSIKKADRSIVYGWLIHALTNVISCIIEITFFI